MRRLCVEIHHGTDVIGSRSCHFKGRWSGVGSVQRTLPEVGVERQVAQDRGIVGHSSTALNVSANLKTVVFVFRFSHHPSLFTVTLHYLSTFLVCSSVCGLLCQQRQQLHQDCKHKMNELFKAGGLDGVLGKERTLRALLWYGYNLSPSRRR